MLVTEEVTGRCREVVSRVILRQQFSFRVLSRRLAEPRAGAGYPHRPGLRAGRDPAGDGSFARQFSLGEGVDSENLTAGYADGVLHVTIPASFTGRFRAGKAPEVLVGALALLAAPPPACPRLRLAANQLITFHHPDISRGPQALKVRTGRG